MPSLRKRSFAKKVTSAAAVIFTAAAEGSSLPFILLALPAAAAAVEKLGAEHDMHLLHVCYRMTEKNSKTERTSF